MRATRATPSPGVATAAYPVARCFNELGWITYSHDDPILGADADALVSDVAADPVVRTFVRIRYADARTCVKGYR